MCGRPVHVWTGCTRGQSKHARSELVVTCETHHWLVCTNLLLIYKPIYWRYQRIKVFSSILLSTILKTKFHFISTNENPTIIVPWRKYIPLYLNVAIMWILTSREPWQGGKKTAVEKNFSPPGGRKNSQIFSGARFPTQVLWKSFLSLILILFFLTIRRTYLTNSGDPVAAGIYI